MSPNYHPQVNDPLSPLQAGFVLTAISSEFRTLHLRSQGPLPGVGPWIAFGPTWNGSLSKPSRRSCVEVKEKNSIGLSFRHRLPGLLYPPHFN